LHISVYLRGILLHYFIRKKSAAEAHRILVQTYGDNALSDTTCRDWFRRFKNNDFQLEDKERSGAPTKFQDKELEQLLDEDPSPTLSELHPHRLCIWWDQQGVIYYEADRRFHSYEEAQKWTDSWIASKDMSFFRRGIHVLPERWSKVVESDGKYFH
ncbi:MOS1T transposase, partial [Pseudoatta argentina]